MINYTKYFFYNVNKKLRLGFLGSYGRNTSGKITVMHRSKGHKKNSYKVDFYRRLNCFGYIMKIIKTCFYSSHLGFIIYENGVCSYQLLSDIKERKYQIYSGDNNIFSENINVRFGYSVLLGYLELFNIVNNIELLPYSGSAVMRAAGCGGLITSKIGMKTLIKLKSGWNILFLNSCMVSVGIGSNPEHKYNNLQKAGYARALGIRPTVRGVAMNPCDHPHGGGEGKKSGSVAARSPWGWLTKGVVSKKKKSFLVKKKMFKKLR